jgi:valyl-tRNA synthetase
LMIARWPAAGERDTEAEAAIQAVMDVVRAIRNARSEYNVEPGRRIAAVIVAGDREALFTSQADILVPLAHLDRAQLRSVADLPAKPEQSLALVVGGVEVYLPLAGMVDLAAERGRLQKELDRVEGLIARSEKSLGNPGFVAKAPPDVVRKERDRLAELQDQAAKLREQLQTVGS